MTSAVRKTVMIKMSLGSTSKTSMININIAPFDLWFSIMRSSLPSWLYAPPTNSSTTQEENIQIDDAEKSAAI
jgi:hypothetical protein